MLRLVIFFFFFFFFFFVVVLIAIVAIFIEIFGFDVNPGDSYSKNIYLIMFFLSFIISCVCTIKLTRSCKNCSPFWTMKNLWTMKKTRQEIIDQYTKDYKKSDGNIRQKRIKEYNQYYQCTRCGHETSLRRKTKKRI